MGAWLNPEACSKETIKSQKCHQENGEGGWKALWRSSCRFLVAQWGLFNGIMGTARRSPTSSGSKFRPSQLNQTRDTITNSQAFLIYLNPSALQLALIGKLSTCWYMNSPNFCVEAICRSFDHVWLILLCAL